MSDRTFRVQSPPMHGDDVRDWQKRIKSLFRKMNIDCPIEPDGVYGVQTRAFSADLVHAYGLSVTRWMKNGVSQELRTKLRRADFTPGNLRTRRSKARKEFRQKLRTRYREMGLKAVHPPVNKIITDTWGYHPGVHDGIDVICPAMAPLFAMVRSRVIDVRSGGWWGKAPSGDVSRGDGIIQLEVLESVGPFKKGQHIGYGHAENACVREGDIVRAGQVIGLAGLAVAWHIHLMVNDGSTTRGIGNIDPRKHLDYAVKNG